MPAHTPHPVLQPLMDRLREAAPEDTVWIPQLQPSTTSSILGWGVRLFVGGAVLVMALEVATALSAWAAAGLLLGAALCALAWRRYAPVSVDAEDVLVPKATEGWEWDGHTRMLTHWVPDPQAAEGIREKASFHLEPAQDWSVGLMQNYQNAEPYRGRTHTQLELRHSRRGPVATVSEWPAWSLQRQQLSDADQYVDLLAAQMQIRRSGASLASKASA